jgi:hypothetical protein
VANLPTTQNVSGTVGIDPTKNAVAVANLPATQPVSGSVSVNNLPATQNVSGTVNIGNLPATQPVSGTVGIDPAHNQVTDTFKTVPQAYSGDMPVGSTVTLANGPIDVSAYKELTLVAGSDVNGPAHVQIQDAASGWVLDSFTAGLTLTIRHYDYLPASVVITVNNPNFLDMQWGVSLYLRGN